MVRGTHPTLNYWRIGMNYLAHFALSNLNQEYIIGNYLGDFIRGAKQKNFSPAIQEGIKLHRYIDSYTDSHPIVVQSKQCIHQPFTRYSGILIDVFYDHFLCQHWQAFYSIPLIDFVQYVYQTLAQYEQQFPERAKFFSQRMKQENILLSYTNIEGIRSTLKRIEQRLRQPNNLSEGILYLTQSFHKLENDFLEFYPQLYGLMVPHPTHIY
jgi:acyl carrier protein phosphodiesterase